MILGLLCQIGLHINLLLTDVKHASVREADKIDDQEGEYHA